MQFLSVYNCPPLRLAKESRLTNLSTMFYCVNSLCVNIFNYLCTINFNLGGFLFKSGGICQPRVGGLNFNSLSQFQGLFCLLLRCLRRPSLSVKMQYLDSCKGTTDQLETSFQNAAGGPIDFIYFYLGRQVPLNLPFIRNKTLKKKIYYCSSHCIAQQSDIAKKSINCQQVFNRFSTLISNWFHRSRQRRLVSKTSF